MGDIKYKGAAMEIVQKAIENITWRSEKFPTEEFKVICANKEEAIPYLRGAVEKAISEKDNLDEDYQLHFYAIFLLAEFQDKESFPRIMELAALPGDTLDFLIGDAITSALSDILYSTYNGDLQLLVKSIYDSHVDDYVRTGMLDVMGQLYLDQKLEKEEFQSLIRKIVYGEEEIGDYLYTALAEIICKCRFVEMLPEIRQLYQDDRIDLFAIGNYDDCIDWMFDYRDYQKNLCTLLTSAAERLKGWAMFQDEEEKEGNAEKSAKALSDFVKKYDRDFKRVKAQVKTGRNDPCPCGSGKKYKQCCLNKPKSPIELIESKSEREKWLEHYPAKKENEDDGRVYLEDFYSSESIELDKILYLALKRRAVPIWLSEDENVAERRKRAYLTMAFRQFQEITEKEEIKSFSEYDSKYSIHYFCGQWLGELQELLREKDEEGILGSVRKLCDRMK